MLAAVAARHRTASRMRRFDIFQRNCIFSLSMHPKKLKLFVWPSNISAGVNLTLRLLAEPLREPSTVTSIPRAIVVPSTIVQCLVSQTLLFGITNIWYPKHYCLVSRTFIPGKVVRLVLYFRDLENLGPVGSHFTKTDLIWNNSCHFTKISKIWNSGSHYHYLDKIVWNNSSITM